MDTNYTPQQIFKFTKFCIRHNIVFNNMVEYRSAIQQFYSKD